MLLYVTTKIIFKFPYSVDHDLSTNFIATTIKPCYTLAHPNFYFLTHQPEHMASRKRCGCQGSQPRLMTQRNVNRAVDAGIGLATVYVGIGALGAIKGALK